MDVYNMIDNLKTKVLGVEFYAAIRESYNQDTSDGPCSALEKEYEASYQHVLSMGNNETTKNLMKQFTDLYEANIDYAASVGFQYGITGAFTQVFTDCTIADGGFQQTVVENLFTLPSMKQHKSYYSRLEQAYKLENTISSLLAVDAHEDLEALECALSNRVYHAALMGFYIGYNSGFDMIETLSPELADRNLEKLLSVRNLLEFRIHGTK